MTAVVILNILFVAFVVVGILSLLGWAILTDRGAPFAWPRRARVAPERVSSSPRRRRQSLADTRA